MNKRQGFTLIELMIVISLIAIFAAVGLTTYSKTQVITRDTRRKQDLQQIAAALNLYYQKYKYYPYSTYSGIISAGGASTSFTYLGSPDWMPALDPFISQVPADPLNEPSSLHVYMYYSSLLGYVAADDTWYSCDASKAVDGKAMVAGQFYVLVTFLENDNDPDSNKNKNYAFCDGRTSLSGVTNYYIIQNGWTPATCPKGQSRCT